MSTIIGIDYGTRLCRTAVFREGVAELFTNRYSDRPQHPILEHRGSSTSDAGLGNFPLRFRSAKQNAGSNSGRLGKQAEQRGGESLVEMFRQVLEDAQAALGEPIDKAVVAVPAFFPERARAAFRDGALNAGFPAVRLSAEAVAAVTGGTKPAEQETTLVYALGAGVFTTAVVRVQGGKARVLASEGNRFFGGNDLDAALIGIMLDRVDGRDHSRDPIETIVRLRDLAENVKIGLSRHPQEELEVNLADLFLDGGAASLEITRSEFEHAIAAPIEETLKRAQEAVKGAGLSLGDLDRVLLIGGSTRVPLVVQRLAEVFPIPQFRAGDGDIALGAALRGGKLGEGDWARSQPESDTTAPDSRLSGRRRSHRLRSSTPAPASSWLNLFAAGITEAEDLWTQGRRSSAIGAFEDVLRQEQEYLGTLYQEMGQGLAREAKYDLAVACLEKAIRHSPGDKHALQTCHETLRDWSMDLLNTGHLTEALKQIRRALQIVPGCPGCMSRSRQIEEAIRMSKRAEVITRTSRKGKKR